MMSTAPNTPKAPPAAAAAAADSYIHRTPLAAATPESTNAMTGDSTLSTPRFIFSPLVQNIIRSTAKGKHPRPFADITQMKYSSVKPSPRPPAFDARSAAAEASGRDKENSMQPKVNPSPRPLRFDAPSTAAEASDCNKENSMQPKVTFQSTTKNQQSAPKNRHGIVKPTCSLGGKRLFQSERKLRPSNQVSFSSKDSLQGELEVARSAAAKAPVFNKENSAQPKVTFQSAKKNRQSIVKPTRLGLGGKRLFQSERKPRRSNQVSFSSKDLVEGNPSLLQGETEVSQDAMAAKNKAIASLKSQVKELSASKSDLESRVHDLTKELDSKQELVKDIDSCTLRAQKLAAQNQELETKYREQSKILGEMKTSREESEEEWKGQWLALSREKHELVDRANDREDELSRLRSLAAGRVALDDKLAEREEELAELRSQLVTLRLIASAKDVADDKLLEQEKELKKLRELVAQYESRQYESRQPVAMIYSAEGSDDDDEPGEAMDRVYSLRASFSKSKRNRRRTKRLIEEKE